MAALTAAMLMLGTAHSTAAADPTELGAFGDWTAFETIEDGKKVCYMTSQPVDARGNYSARDPIYAFVIHRPADDVRDEFIYQTGYSYKPGTTATLTIDDDRFTLTTDGDLAFTRDTKQERNVVEAIRKGRGMTMVGRSTRDTETTDRFSLKGSSDAYDAITNACLR